MKHYETLYLLTPDLSEDEYKASIAKFTEIIENHRGEVIKMEEWGKRPLAYDVKKFDRGFYVLLDFCGDAGLISELGRNFKLDERVLKYQTLKLSDHADVEALRAQAAPRRAEAPLDEQPEEDNGITDIDEESTDEDREEG